MKKPEKPFMPSTKGKPMVPLKSAKKSAKKAPPPFKKGGKARAC